MSRSYRRPYSSVCGVESAKKDKQRANRGVRRAQDRVTRLLLRDPDSDVLMPHRLECSWNEVYSWVRDGGNKFHHPDLMNWAWSNHVMAVLGIDRFNSEYYLEWPPEWYRELLRK